MKPISKGDPAMVCAVPLGGRLRDASPVPAPSRRADPAALLSVVVPMHNEEQNIDLLLARLMPVLERVGMAVEVLCVDDGSTDNTVALLQQHRAFDPRLRILCLSRNFGKEVALAAGLAYAGGDAVVMMDADLQHPPELIETFIRHWRDGYDMVFGVHQHWRRPTLARRIATAAFYRLFSTLARTDLPRGAGDFRLLDRRVVDVLNACPERSRFSKGLYAWVGFRQIAVPFEVAPRAAGHSRWSLFTLWQFGIDAITSFSMMPLRVWSYLGGAISLLALSYGSFIIIRTLALGRDVPGYPSLIVAITFFAGVQLIGLGVIGEYLGRVFTEVKRRPLFVVREAIGFEASARTAANEQEAQSLSRLFRPVVASDGVSVEEVLAVSVDPRATISGSMAPLLRPAPSSPVVDP